MNNQHDARAQVPEKPLLSTPFQIFLSENTVNNLSPYFGFSSSFQNENPLAVKYTNQIGIKLQIRVLLEI